MRCKEREHAAASIHPSSKLSQWGRSIGREMRGRAKGASDPMPQSVTDTSRLQPMGNARMATIVCSERKQFQEQGDHEVEFTLNLLCVLSYFLYIYIVC